MIVSNITPHHIVCKWKKQLIPAICLFLCSSISVQGENVQLTAANGKIKIDDWQARLTVVDANGFSHYPSSKSSFKLQKEGPGKGGAKSVCYNLALANEPKGSLSLSLIPQKDGVGLKGTADFQGPAKINLICFESWLPGYVYDRVSFEVDGKQIDFPDSFQKSLMFSERVKRLRFPTANGEILIEGDFQLLIYDTRQWRSAFRIKIGFPATGNKQNMNINLKMRFGKAGDWGPALGSVKQIPYVAKAGKDWKPFTYHRSVIHKSALDFSGNLDAPAGKYGYVISKADGHFVFAKRQDIPARFYGVNFVDNSQIPTKKQAKILADSIASIGFNAIRIHHHDNIIYDKTGKEPSRINKERMDRLDYFISCMKKKGIYYTTDIFVSRRNIPATELPKLGGIKSGNEYKALFYIDESVFDNWKAWAKAFLCHVNPYTGIALKDDPALVTLSLVNEGNPFRKVSASARSRKMYSQKYIIWKMSNPGQSFEHFLSYLAIKRYKEMKKFIRGLGCKTLLTDQNHEYQIYLSGDRTQYDFVDNHVYWDIPYFPKRNWRLPACPSQINALGVRAGIPQIFPTRLFGKGFTITEFNYTNPNIYRSAGAMMISSYAAFQNWDGLFVFAYSHSINAAMNPHEVGAVSGYLDIATDPVKAFSQRIGAKIFLSGGINPGKNAFAAIVTEPLKQGAKANYPDPFIDLGFLARIGSITKLPAPKYINALVDIGNGTGNQENIPVIKSSDDLVQNIISKSLIPAKCYDASEKRFTTPSNQLELNRKQQTLRVCTPNIEAFALGKDQQLAGKYLKVKNNGRFSVFALIPIGTPELKNTDRMTLIHLVNTQATGMKFSSDRFGKLESWGKLPFLAQRGTALVSLKIPAGNWDVYALNTAGKRISKLPVKMNRSGFLELKLDNTRWKEAVFAYELNKKTKDN